MVNITLPDGNLKTFENAPTGLELAESISADFARNCVAMELNKELVDLSTSISADSGVRLITQKRR
jgi:threonyl-tRNA synthetase